MREGACGEIDPIRFPPRTSHRFVIARPGPAEVAVVIAGPPGVRIFDLLDRACFPTEPGEAGEA